jgi:hypothetical protein
LRRRTENQKKNIQEVDSVQQLERELGKSLLLSSKIPALEIPAFQRIASQGLSARSNAFVFLLRERARRKKLGKS